MRAKSAHGYPAVAKDLSELMDHQAKTRVLSAAANGKKGHSLISDAKFRQLYELALLVRGAGGRAMSSVHWREALLAGVMADLRSGDAVLTESDTWASGALRPRLAAALRSPAGNSMADLVVESLSGSTTDRLRQNTSVTVIFEPKAGAGAVLEEARKLASAAKLAVLFVGDGRGKAAMSNGKDAAGEAMPSIPVDADDVVAIYRVAHESITRARQGGGPTQIVCARWQPAGKTERTRKNAVRRLEPWLESRGLPVQEWREEILRATETARVTSETPVDEADRVDSQPVVQADIQTD